MALPFRPSANSRIRRRPFKRPAAHRVRCGLELLESRWVLASVTPIESVLPQDAQQLLLAPDTSQFEIRADQVQAGQALFRFALDGIHSLDQLLVDLVPHSPGTTTDAAIGLFDASGNQLLWVDNDPEVPSPDIESLSATIHSAQPYVLGFFFDPSNTLTSYTVELTPGPQRTNALLAIDPNTGEAHFSTTSTDDILISSSDVDYYPLALVNAARSGTVEVTPTGLDADLFAQVYRRDRADLPWLLQSTGGQAEQPGGAISLSLAPPTDRSLTDAEYLLAVAPRNFTAAGGTYEVHIAAAVLSPGTISTTTVPELLPAVSPGTLQQVASLSVSPDNPWISGFRAADTGDALIEITQADFASVVSVYDEPGTTLLAVASRHNQVTASDPLQLALPANSGTGYVVRVASLNGTAGSATVRVTSHYSPSVTTLTDAPVHLGSLALAPNNAPTIVRFVLDDDADLLVLDAQPENSPTLITQFTILSNTLAPVNYLSSAAGASLTTYVDVSQHHGPIDVIVSPAAGSGFVTFRAAQVDIPETLAPIALEGASIDLQGDLQTSWSTTSFGQLQGTTFYNLVTETEAPTHFVAAGAQSKPLVAVYEEVAGQLQLAEWSHPNANGSSLITRPLSLARQFAVGVIPLGFVGGAIAVNVDGPVQTGVGVGMVPGNAPIFPSTNSDLYQPDSQGNYHPPYFSDAGPWTSELNIRAMVFEEEYEQHLWRTILPFNILPASSATIQLDPETLLGAKLEVFRPVYGPTGAIVHAIPMATQNSINGTTAELVVPASQLIPGETLLFRVSPLPDQLDDGIYTLSMSIGTDNPHPHEVTERFWRFDAANHLYEVDNGYTEFRILDPNSNLLPLAECIPNNPQPCAPGFTDRLVGTPIDIPQNQWGYGFVDANFRKQVGSAFEANVFRIRAVDARNATLRVWTEGLSPTVNTNLRVYRRQQVELSDNQTFDGLVPFDMRNAFESDDELLSTLPNFDWFPANRSEIDAQAWIADLSQFEFFDDEFLYVVVKNQEGSVGSYRVHVQLDVEFSDRQFGAYSVTNLPASSFGPASSSIQLTDLDERLESVAYLPVYLPDFHDGQLSVTSPVSPSSTQTWKLHAYDVNGQELAADRSLLSGATQAHFAVPLGPQLIYLRIEEPAASTSATGTVQLTTDVNRPTDFGTVSAPSAHLPNVSYRDLHADPWSDAHASGTLTSGGKSYYYLAASPGLMQIQVQPAGRNPVRWGVYIAGELVAWDYTGTRATSNWTQVAVPGAFHMLPSFDQPVEGVSGTHSQKSVLQYVDDPVDVVVLVEAIDGDASFDMQVDSAAQFPLRTQELILDPRNVVDSYQVPAGEFRVEADVPPPTLSGRDWAFVNLPEGAGLIELQVSRPEGLGGVVPISYDVLLLDGTPIISGDTAIGSIPPYASIALPSSISGGRPIMVRTSAIGDPSRDLQLGVTFSIATSNAPADRVISNIPQLPNLLHLNPQGDGQLSGSNSYFFPLWIDQPGKTTITTQVTGGVAARFKIEVYRMHETRTGQEFQSNALVLTDYANKSSAISSLENFQLHLERGAYAVKILSTTPSGNIQVRVDAPEFDVQDIVLDPNSGLSNLPGFYINDIASPHSNTSLVEAYQQSMYRVTVPLGTIGQASAHAIALSKGSLEYDHTSRFAVWQRNSQGLFSLQYGDDLPDDYVIDPVLSNGQLSNHTGNATMRVRPAEDLYIMLDRSALDASVRLHAIAPVPVSGTPDLVVLPITLSPHNGATHAAIQVANIGYAPAFGAAAHYRVRNTAAIESLQWTTTLQAIATLGPFGTSSRVYVWNPVLPTDEIEFIADFEEDTTDDIVGAIEELDETNNDAGIELSTVDASRPVVEFARLTDPALDGTGTSDNIWGRYVADVVGLNATIEVQVFDPDDSTSNGTVSQIYQTVMTRPSGTKLQFGNSHYNTQSFNPGLLSPDKANIYDFTAIDIWGLKSEVVQRTAQVVPYPKWLRTVGTLLFDTDEKIYKLHYENAVIDYDKTLNQILPFNVPFIGDEQNRFYIGLSADTDVSLDPSQSVSLPVVADAELVLLGNTVFDVHYSDEQQTGQVGVDVTIAVDDVTLEATAFFVGFRLSDINILNYTSPEIPLFAFGIKGLASINANLLIDIAADLDAGLTLAFDPLLAIDPLAISPTGLGRPTFVGLDFNPALTIEGEAELLGFLDIASLTGTIGLNFELLAGLKSDGTDHDEPNEVIPIEDFFDNFGVEMNVSITIGASAKILGIEIWDYDWESPPIISLGDDVVTWEDIGPQNAPAMGPLPNPNLGPIDPTQYAPEVEEPLLGTAAMQPIDVTPQPQLLLAGTDGLFVQTVPGATGQGNFAFARRINGLWQSTNTLLPQPEHVVNPALAWTYDGPGTPAVLVYQASSYDPSVPGANVDGFLTSQQIRSRYFDGTNWSEEQILENNGRYDGNPSIAFNSTGQGAAVWTQNTNPSPLRDPTSNEIMVARWDSTTHAWLPPQQLTIDSTIAASDNRPDVFVSEDGVITVVWLRNSHSDATQSSGAGDEVWFSQYAEGNWSPPAVMPSWGLEQGPITQVAIDSSGSSNGEQRIDVLLAQTTYHDADGDPTTEGDDTATSRLLHRSSTASSFGNGTSAQLVAQGANFAYVDLLPEPSGSGLVAYWQQSDGRENEIMAASLAGPGQGGSTWSRTTRLTHGNILEASPSLAIDTSDTEPVFRLLFDQRLPLYSNLTLPSPTTATSGGIPLSGTLNGQQLAILPELRFVKELSFPGQQTAPAGTSATSTATIVNDGLVSARVSVDFVRQQDQVLLANRQIVLNPGQQIELHTPIPVITGAQTIEAVLTAIEYQTEMFSLDNNRSFDTITGAVDLAVDAIVLPGSFQVGDTISIDVTVSNLSDQSISTPVDIGLYLDDPPHEIETNPLVAMQTANTIAPFQTQTLTYSWTVPYSAAVYTFGAKVDVGNQIVESSELNNVRRVVADVSTDVRIDSLELLQLSGSGNYNVSVRANLSTSGPANADNVVAELWWSRNGAEFQKISEQVIPQLVTGTSVTIPMIAQFGYAGDNNYRVVLDPGQRLVEFNRVDNAAQANLYIVGFPDLIPQSPSLNQTTPIPGVPANTVVILQNAGIDDAHDVLVEVFARTANLGRRLVGSITVDHLPPLTSQLLQIPIQTAFLEGDVTFEVVVDRHEHILEMNALNNTEVFRARFGSRRLMDYGDAPEYYPVFLADDGARHDRLSAPPILGQRKDWELEALADTGGNATGDNGSGEADEDGVAWLDPLEPGQLAHIEVTTGGFNTFLNAWIDFNRDGDWTDQGEQILIDVPSSPATTQFTFRVPDDAHAGTTYARFRISTASGLKSTGYAPDGEVEDYRVLIGGPTGDLNEDGSTNALDVDLLAAALRLGDSSVQYDIDGDGNVTKSDLNFLVTDVIGTLLGDINLDFVVDTQDFVVWRQHAFATTESWAFGDLTGDGVTDARDFNQWNATRFRQAPQAARAPRHTPRAPLPATTPPTRTEAHDAWFAAFDPPLRKSQRDTLLRRQGIH